MKPSSMVEDQMDYVRWILAGAAVFLQSIPELTLFLLWLMVLDMAFGFGVAWKQRDVSPTAAWKGVTRKMGSLGIILLAAVIDQYVDLLGINLVQVTTVFYIGPEILSILRNAAILEVPVPPQFVSVLRVFQDKNEKPNDANKPLP